MDKKVLIIGKSEALEDKFKEQGVEVFTSYEADIREDKACELLEFVLENGIDLTVPVSVKSKTIADIFHANGQLIFAGGHEVALLGKSAGLKILYSARVPVPRFAVFERVGPALDYLKNAEFPVVISGQIFTSFDTARKFTEFHFTRDNEIVITEYVFGTPFTLYLITDGAVALPVTCVGQQDELLYAPDYKVSQELETEIIDALTPVLEGCCGIFGVKCVLQDDGGFKIFGLEPFFCEKSARGILSLIEEDIYTLFKACALGSFADDYDYIKMSENSVVSHGNVCAQGRTLSRAIENLQELTNNV